MVDWKVENEGPIAGLLSIEITQSKDGKVKLAQQTNYIVSSRSSSPHAARLAWSCPPTTR